METTDTDPGSGFGGASGTATDNGSRVRLEFTYSRGCGYYQWTMICACTAADETVVDTSGGKFIAHIKR